MLAFLIHFHRRKGQLLFVDSGTVSSLGVRIFGRPKVQGLLDLDKAGPTTVTGQEVHLPWLQWVRNHQLRCGQHPINIHWVSTCFNQFYQPSMAMVKMIVT